MENNKYYTPDISELYVGYELEGKMYNSSKLDSTEDEWIKLILNSPDFTSLCDRQGDTFSLSKTIYRTKFLDSSDIISLGFNKISENKYEIICSNPDKVEYMTKFYIELYDPYQTPWITITHEDVSWTKIKYSYVGRCKSKNELKKILLWIM